MYVHNFHTLTPIDLISGIQRHIKMCIFGLDKIIIYSINMIKII